MDPSDEMMAFVIFEINHGLHVTHVADQCEGTGPANRPRSGRVAGRVSLMRQQRLPRGWPSRVTVRPNLGETPARALERGGRRLQAREQPGAVTGLSRRAPRPSETA